MNCSVFFLVSFRKSHRPKREVGKKASLTVHVYINKVEMIQCRKSMLF